MKDESIFRGMIEFVAPNDSRYRYDKSNQGLYEQQLDEFGRPAYRHVAHLPVRGRATPRRIWAAVLDDHVFAVTVAGV